MKKIFILGNKLSRGGAEAVIVSQVRVLNEAGYDVNLGLLRQTNKPSFYRDLPISRSKIFHFDFDGLLSLRAFFRLVKFLYQQKPDMIITHLFESNLLGRVAALISGISIIVATEHSVYNHKKKWQILIDRILSKSTRAIFAVSKEVADFTARQEKIPKNKFQVVKQIINIDNLKSGNKDDIFKKLAIPLDKKIVLTIGRFSPEKGSLKIPEIANRCILKMGPLAPFFLIVGYGPLEAKLKEDIASLNLVDQVFVVNDPERAKEYLSAGDVFLLPSDREGVPLAMLEAMVCGLPPVASAVGGVPELVTPNNGVLVKPDDIDGFCIAIEDLLSDPSRLSEMSKAAKKDAISYVQSAEQDFLLLVSEFFK